MTWSINVEKLCPWEGEGPARLNLDEKLIGYEEAISGGRNLHVLTGPEEVARAFLVHRIVCELGYPAERLELEREYAAGRRTQGKRPRIDLILSKPDGTPYFFIEAKEPEKFETDKPEIETQLFSLAGLHEAETGHRVPYLVYWTIDTSGNSLSDKVIVIDREAYPTHREWMDAGEPSVANILWDGYGVPRRVPYVKGSDRDLTSSFKMADIDALARNLHDVLWGGGATGDTEVFTSLVNLILAKIQDEYDTVEGGEYDFQVRMRGQVAENDKDLLERINTLYRKALAQQLGKHGDLSDQQVVNREKFSESKVRYTVEQIERYAFVDGKESLTGRDILGEFFERIQRDGFKQTKGQFFTPPNVVRFMLYALEIDEMAFEKLSLNQTLPYVIDPSCGSATFLIEAMRTITSELKGRRHLDLPSSRTVAQRYEELFLPDHREHRWARDFLYGVEHNFDLATAAKVNMILHGDGASNIFHADGLAAFENYTHDGHTGERLRNSAPADEYSELPVNGRFDVVISNPPFSVDLDKETKRGLRRGFLFSDKKNSENLFIERYYQLLAEGGRMAIVLPESVFDTTENKYIRLFLFWYFDVVAVVSLPQLAFQPYTQTKTSVLFARKKRKADVLKWADSWSRGRSLWGQLRTRVRNYFDVHVHGKSAARLTSIAGRSEDDIVKDVAEITRGEAVRLTGEPIRAFLERNATLIEAACEADAKLNSLFGECNTTWVFERLVRESDLSIFAAEAREIGYKRSSRRVLPRPNELYDVEVAPSKLDLTALAADLQEHVNLAERKVLDLEARCAEASAPRREGGATRQVPVALQRSHEAATASRDEAIARRDRVLASVAPFYDEDGELRPEFVDRRDEDLRRLFDDLDLAPYRSSRIIPLREEPETILEQMREAKLWSV